MADKVTKPKKSKPKTKKDERGVLAALPSTRPERIGTRRTGTTVSAATQTAAASAKTAKPAAAKPAATAPAGEPSYPRTSPAAKKKPATRRKAAASRPTAARRRAAAPRTFEPTEAAEAAAGAADERAVGVTTEPRPRPVREGAPGMGTISPDRDQPSPESGRPSGVELVTTAVQAAGELTQIGLTIGGRIIKRAVDRLPKP
jgi:hypothetical protein